MRRLSCLPKRAAQQSTAAAAPLPAVADVAARRSGPWTEALTNGSIELVAISRHPSAGQPRWRPDGTPYTGKQLDAPGLRSAVDDATVCGREFVFRLPKEASLSVPRLGAGGDLGKHKPLQCGWEFLGGVSLRGSRISQVRGNSQYSSCRGLRRLGNGVRVTPAIRSIKGIAHGVEYTISLAAASEGGRTVVNVDHTRPYQQDTRLIAVDQRGQEHTLTRSKGSLKGDLRRLTATFQDLPLERDQGIPLSGSAPTRRLSSATWRLSPEKRPPWKLRKSRRRAPRHHSPDQYGSLRVPNASLTHST